jgi:microcystin-dependent protein
MSNDTLKILLLVFIVYTIYTLLNKKEGYSMRYGALSGSNNMVLTDDKGNLSSIQFPKGMIVLWNGSASSVPEGWALCDGSNGTPDLRGKFVLGVNPQHDNQSYRTVGGNGGNESIKLTEAQMPAHSHGHADAFLVENWNWYNDQIGWNRNHINWKDDQSNGIKGSGDGDWDNSPMGKWRQTDVKGGGAPINIMPPFYTLAYIMKL